MKIYKYIKDGANAISISAGQNRFVKVPIAPEGSVSKFVLRQASGTDVDYEVDLFDKQLLTEGENVTALPANAELYRVFPTKEGTAGVPIVDYTTGESGYSYRNTDGSHTDPKRQLWLHIRPIGAGGATTWEVAIVVENDIG
jgi:hypothetical protein